MKTRLKDIAAILGVSISQVSRALSNKNGVAPKIREAILAEARKNEYQNHSGKHSRKIAIVFRDISPGTIVQLEKLRKKFKRKKYRILFLFPESCGFLCRYRVDKVLAFDLPPEDWISLQRECHQLHLSVSIVSAVN